MESEETSPFLLYAIESPSYPERLFGCRDIVPQGREAISIEGTALFISGGEIKCDSNNEVAVMPTGLVSVAVDDVGKRFAEQFVAALVEPDDRVLLLYESVFDNSKEGITSARDLGFEILETSGIAVYLGGGRLLPGFKWLDSACACSYTHLFASSGARSNFESEVIRSAQDGSDLRELMREFYSKLYYRPELALKDLGDFHMYTSLGGIEEQDIAVNLRDTDPNVIRDAVVRAVSHTDAAVYNAGKVSDLEASGYFEGAYSWIPLPDSWSRELV